MKPLIIHTEASRGWGGQEIRTLTECRWFREHGYDVELITTSDAQISSAARKEHFVVHHRALRKKTQLSDLAFCLKLFRKRLPLMVGTHSNIDTRVGLCAAKLTGVPNRFRYRHVSIPVRSNFWNRFIYQKCATRIITTAESIASNLRADFNLPVDKAQCIATGIALPAHLLERDTARKALCRELHLPKDSRFIGQISVLRDWKGHNDVMAAFNQISQKLPNHHLVFVGGGSSEGNLKETAAATSCADRIHFLGHKPDPWPYFRSLDLNILASTSSEGIPQSGMQAMLAETPFLGTTTGGIPEIITDLETGYLTPPNSPASLAKAIIMILENTDQTKRTTEAAKQWSLLHCLEDLMGKKVQKLLE
ncbi:MAG: glycosyltransferase family 4 protein [Akkermansiaceae bacterium]